MANRLSLGLHRPSWRVPSPQWGKGRDRFLHFQFGSSSCEKQQAHGEGKGAEFIANTEGSIRPSPQDDLSSDGDATRGSLSTVSWQRHCTSGGYSLLLN